LTQNTNWKSVEKALNELRRNNCLSVKSILETKQETLAQYIKSSGYNNQKSERLKIIARFLLQHPLDELQKMEIIPLRNLLLSVKGIGPETADSIIVYAFMKQSFVIDTYTKRIMSRIGFCGKDVSYDDLQAVITNNVEKDVEIYSEYHALLVEHAKRYCRVKPLCGECILKDVCEKKI
ncbi:MAG: endonuclease, partial [Nanoarchaeota archaeon]